MTKKKADATNENSESIPTLSEESSELGTIRINHSVVAGIVRLATQSVPGVVNVGGGGLLKASPTFSPKKNPSVVYRFQKRKVVDMKSKYVLY